MSWQRSITLRRSWAIISAASVSIEDRVLQFVVNGQCWRGCDLQRRTTRQERWTLLMRFNRSINANTDLTVKAGRSWFGLGWRGFHSDPSGGQVTLAWRPGRSTPLMVWRRDGRILPGLCCCAALILVWLWTHLWWQQFGPGDCDGHDSDYGYFDVTVTFELTFPGGCNSCDCSNLNLVQIINSHWQPKTWTQFFVTYCQGQPARNRKRNDRKMFQVERDQEDCEKHCGLFKCEKTLPSLDSLPIDTIITWCYVCIFVGLVFP